MYGDDVAILNSNITLNGASLGGGVYFFATNNVSYTGVYNFSQTIISNNTASVDGGGLYSFNLNHTFNVFGATLKDNIAFSNSSDHNVACADPASPFCFSCVAGACDACAPNANQSCSQNSTASSVFCYTNLHSVCMTNSTCQCETAGMTTKEVIFIVVIALCLVIGLILIVIDVIRYFHRRNQSTGYSPIK